MFLDFLINPIVLHAGTPIVLSQTTLTLMFVVLGVVLVGIGFGRLPKSNENLLQHRWTLSIAIVLTCGAIFLVMLPAAFMYYTDPDVEVYSSLSFATIIHGILAFPAIVMGITYTFGDLPQKVKKWMRWTALFWVIGIASGVFLFLQMTGLL